MPLTRSIMIIDEEVHAVSSACTMQTIQCMYQFFFARADHKSRKMPKAKRVL